MLRVLISVLLSLMMFQTQAYSAVKGGIEKRELKNYNQIIDSVSGSGIAGAKVKVPHKRFVTVTDADGYFALDVRIDAPTVLSVEKDGYRPFSLTINKLSSEPLIIGIEKNSLNAVSVETELIHLGDDKFSENSANAGDFVSKSVGPYYSKNFTVPSFSANDKVYLVIGSVIGIDTLRARDAGQSRVVSAYASPAEIFCNGNKICELHINGDRQEIEIPKQILRKNGQNSLTMKAGKNLFQTAFIDYDDIEFTNISVEIR